MSPRAGPKNLPLSTYTEAYWKADLHNLLHFLQLRMDDHAQEEIRVYTSVIGEEIVAKWVPLVWEAFKDYRRQALRLSRIEIDVLSALAGGSPERGERRRPRRGCSRPAATANSPRIASAASSKRNSPASASRFPGSQRAMQLKVKKLNPSAVMPWYARDGDAGLDLFAVQHSVIEPGRSALVPTGIAIELPPGPRRRCGPEAGWR